MFSKRTSWRFAPNRLTRLLNTKQKANEEVLDLTESNPTRAGFQYPEDEILAGLQDRRSLVYEPTPQGMKAAREAIARYYAESGKTMELEDLLLTAGTSEAYALLFKLLGDPGDQVLIPRPSYPLLDYLVALESLEAVSYPLTYDGAWSLDTAALEEAVGPRSRAVLVVHPGNPTGSYLKQHELSRLVGLCRRHRLALIVDEVFLDYPLAPDPERAGSIVGEQRVLTFVLSGVSKIAGLPQMKLSWIWVGGPEPERREARVRLEHINDVFLSVGAPAQNAAQQFLAIAKPVQALISSRLSSNYDFLREAATDTAIDVPRVEGGWYSVLRLPSLMSSEQWALELLDCDNVSVHPGYLFDFSLEAYLVVSLLTPPSVFRVAIQRLFDRVASTVAETSRLG